MLSLWKKPLNHRSPIQRVMTSLQWAAGAALLVGLGSWNLWAGSGPDGPDGPDGPENDAYLSGGDSIGTLPIIFSGPDSQPGGPSWETQSLRDRATLTVTLPGASLRHVLQGSNGTGYLEWTALDEERVQLRLFGEGQLALDPALVAAGAVTISLQSDSPAPWFYAAQVDGWFSQPAQASQEGVALDLNRALPDQWGTAPLTLHARVWPGKASSVRFAHQGGYLIADQIMH